MARETLLRTIANTPQTSPNRGETGTSKYWAHWKALASGANTREVTGGAVPGSLAGARRLNNLVSKLLNLS